MTIILANMMQSVMPLIINSSQKDFIKKRISKNNIILASELLREFNSSSREIFFCAKLDIHKTIDTVFRDFLLNRMVLKGSSIFISWIKGYIEDFFFSIVLNSFFSSSSGIR
ncbi:hypothetical protein KFK09_011296 [Dendrobium nobile]|uniref:Uncharacterized protein n=1 Tax=Dendrobium nobile TaxID=94219 RepID=A0A8T3BEH8_DENNO|nr:hypothetical protein KFK09_011296 [Dendrobium nobile]